MLSTVNFLHCSFLLSRGIVLVTIISSSTELLILPTALPESTACVHAAETLLAPFSLRAA